MRFEPRTPDEGINSSKQNPLREAVVLLVAVVLLAAAFLFWLGFVVEAGVARIPPTWEAKVFRSTWSAWTAPADAARSSEQEAAQALCERLAARWPDNPYQLRVEILDDPVPNAMALPGGLLLLTRGLLDTVESENELAFVLGHELGHFRNRDHLRAIGRRAGAQLALSLVSALAGVQIGSLNLLEELAARRFGRDQERAADAFGLDLVYREYGHVQGAVRFFEKLPAAESALGKRFERFLSTHPVSDDRVAALRALAEARGWPRDGTPTPWPPP